MKRLIGNLVCLAVLAALAGLIVAPVFAFFAIRSAARADDVAGLSRLIDFDAVRSSLRPQLTGDGRPQAPPPSFIEDPIGAVRHQFEQAAPLIAPPDVNAWLTPDALEALLRGEGRRAAARDEATPGWASSSADGAAPWPRPQHWGLNRVRMSVAGSTGDQTTFTFERRGPYEWKLVHIGLPEQAR